MILRDIVWLIEPSLLHRGFLNRGHSFFSTNAELLEAYAACDSAADIIAAQNAWLEQAASGACLWFLCQAAV